MQIDPKELAAELSGESPPRLIDVRSAQEQEIAHIDGFLPVSDALLKEMIASWPRDVPIVTYCHLGIRSLNAASQLVEQGFTNVRSLRGGIQAWAEQIDPNVATY